MVRIFLSATLLEFKLQHGAKDLTTLNCRMKAKELCTLTTIAYVNIYLWVFLHVQYYHCRNGDNVQRATQGGRHN